MRGKYQTKQSHLVSKNKKIVYILSFLSSLHWIWGNGSLKVLKTKIGAQRSNSKEILDLIPCWWLDRYTKVAAGQHNLKKLNTKFTGDLPEVGQQARKKHPDLLLVSKNKNAGLCVANMCNLQTAQ